ncbi:AAA family ATPase [Planctomycetota bacterium]
MRSTDVPQDATPQRIRHVVEAVCDGALTPEEVGERTGLSRRHVSYHLQAARVLGLLEQAEKWYRVTDLGEEWLSQPPASAADRACFAQALRHSEPVKRLAPGLLSDREPRIADIAERIVLLAGLAPETARRRAQTLMRYRSYARADELSLFDGLSRPRARTSAKTRMVPANRDTERGAPIRYLHARNYGCIRDAAVFFGPLTVVLGRNGAGKTTLFDAVAFCSDALQDDVTSALLKRVTCLEEILWFGRGQHFELALELTIPEPLRQEGLTDARYEIAIGRDPDGVTTVLAEALFLKPPPIPRGFCQTGKPPEGWKQILSLTYEGTALYQSERTSWRTAFQLGTGKLALSQLPEDKDRFAVASWVKSVLRKGVQRVQLDGQKVAAPASPLLDDRFRTDGSNIPRAAKRLKRSNPKAFKEWVRHAAKALPEIDGVGIAERPEDKHLYLTVKLKGGLTLPAWRLSEGALRLLALTLLPHLPTPDAVYLIEEPENGIFPQALETVFQALSSCRGSQVLLATHSPVLLGIVPLERLLVLQKRGGETKIAGGREHKVLRHWQQDVDLGSLFAAGVLT